MNYILELLSSNNEKVVMLGTLLEEIKKSVEEKTITQDECEELLRDTHNMQKLIEDSISLDARIAINKALGQLYNIVLMGKQLLPL